MEKLCVGGWGAHPIIQQPIQLPLITNTLNQSTFKMWKGQENQSLNNYSVIKTLKHKQKQNV